MKNSFERVGPWIAVILALLTFGQVVGFDFVSWDDPLHVYRNPMVVDGTVERWWHWFSTPALGYPSPLTVLSYRLEWVLVGPGAWLYHTTNLCLHALAVYLCHRLGRRIGLGAAGALVASIIFALHPAVAEPVSWVSGRKDLLAAALVLGATLECLNHPFAIRRPRTWLAGAMILAAALCKPVALFVMFAWPMLIWQLHPKPRDSSAMRTALSACIPVVAIALIVIPVAMMGQEATGSLREGGAFQLLREAWYAGGFHIGLIAMVRDNCAKYLPLPWPPVFSVWIDLFPVFAATLCAGLMLAMGKAQRRVAAMGLGWALLAYLPSSNLVPLTRFLADVYLYLPLCGVGWFAGAFVDAGLQRGVSPARRPLAAIIVALLLAALLVPRTLDSTARWNSSAELWTQNFEQYPHDYRLCRNIGNAYNDGGRPDIALEQYLRCRQIFGTGDFDKNIAITLYRLGHLDESLKLLKELARRAPADPIVQKYLNRIKNQSAGGQPDRSK